MRECFHVINTDRMTAPLLPDFLCASVVRSAAGVVFVVDETTFVMQDASQRVFPGVDHFLLSMVSCLALDPALEPKKKLRMVATTVAKMKPSTVSAKRTLSGGMDVSVIRKM